MDNCRCFIAVDLPYSIKDILANIQRQLKLWPAKVKWVEEQNFHLTLKFLGDVPVEKIQQIEPVLSEVCLRQKELRIILNGIGAFPNISKPRVIWVAIRDEDKGLKKIWSELESALEQLGFPKEERRFSPHLTLGRVKEPAGGLAIVIQRLHPVEITVPVKEIKFMSSRLSRSGPEYSCINSFYLQEH